MLSHHKFSVPPKALTGFCYENEYLSIYTVRVIMTKRHDAMEREFVQKYYRKMADFELIINEDIGAHGVTAGTCMPPS